MGREQQTAGKTYQYKLKPTPEQEQALETVRFRCQTLYNVALEQRKTWWGRGQGIGATYSQQKAELPDLKAACPDYAEVNAQGLQDVLLRVERTYQAFFRRVAAGETPGCPRFQGRGRSGRLATFWRAVPMRCGYPWALPSIRRRDTLEQNSRVTTRCVRYALEPCTGAHRRAICDTAEGGRGARVGIGRLAECLRYKEGGPSLERQRLRKR